MKQRKDFGVLGWVVALKVLSINQIYRCFLNVALRHVLGEEYETKRNQMCLRVLAYCWRNRIIWGLKVQN